jgi:transcription elongation factor
VVAAVAVVAAEAAVAERAMGGAARVGGATEETEKAMVEVARAMKEKEGAMAAAVRVTEAMKAVNEGTAMEEGYQAMTAMQAEGLTAVGGSRVRSRTHSCTNWPHSYRMTTRRTV